MRAIRFVAAVLVAMLFVAFASEAFAQCGRVVTQQSVQAAPQPQVSVFQLPASAPVTASQSATIGGQTFAPQSLPQSGGSCASGQCTASSRASSQTFVQSLPQSQPAQATVLQTTSVRQRGFGLLDTIRAARAERVARRSQPRPQTIRQLTVVRS